TRRPRPLGEVRLPSGGEPERPGNDSVVLARTPNPRALLRSRDEKLASAQIAPPLLQTVRHFALTQQSRKVRSHSLDLVLIPVRTPSQHWRDPPGNRFFAPWRAGSCLCGSEFPVVADSAPKRVGTLKLRYRTTPGFPRPRQAPDAARSNRELPS